MTSTIDDSGSKLQYKNEKNETFTVQYNDHRLVKRPGYETLIYEIDDVHFENKGDYVFMTVTRDHHDYTYLIGEKYEKTKKEEKEEDEDEGEGPIPELPAIQSEGISP